MFITLTTSDRSHTLLQLHFYLHAKLTGGPLSSRSPTDLLHSCPTQLLLHTDTQHSLASGDSHLHVGEPPEVSQQLCYSTHSFAAEIKRTMANAYPSFKDSHGGWCSPVNVIIL